MPFKSEAQRRLFHVLEARGEISPRKVREWEHATKDKGSLPYHVKKKKKHEKRAYDIGVMHASEQFNLR
jgi:hypothetical protein